MSVKDKNGRFDNNKCLTLMKAISTKVSTRVSIEEKYTRGSNNCTIRKCLMRRRERAKTIKGCRMLRSPQNTDNWFNKREGENSLKRSNVENEQKVEKEEIKPTRVLKIPKRNYVKYKQRRYLVK
ncbi:unnamed protein product [Moneuplotes crassus]|uniref:Uncharacterized protein n=1 Tax=Euplotes crassus TaxID=5936 RepID=A0AAD2D6W2_EUPCR|nr:unnamed protein product [Moneuplotes crassus]